MDAVAITRDAVDALMMWGFLRHVGEFAWVILIVAVVILALRGLLFGKDPIRRDRGPSRAVIQERRINQEESSSDLDVPK
jgi:hypothetical protein